MIGLGWLAKKVGGFALKKAIKPILKQQETKIREAVDGGIVDVNVSDFPDSEMLQDVGVWIDSVGKDVFGKYGDNGEKMLFVSVQYALSQIEKGAEK